MDHILDTVGLKCPQPVLKLAITAPKIAPGSVLTMKGNCPTFEYDIRKWCERLNKTLLSVTTKDDVVTIEILF